MSHPHSHSHSHPLSGPSQPQHQPQPNPSISMPSAALTGPSTYQQAHILVRSYLAPTPFLTAEERTLYMLDVVRYAAWQANVDLKLVRREEAAVGLGHVELKHVQVAMVSLGGPGEWKARRIEWEGFSRTNMGVAVVEEVMVIPAGTGRGAGLVENPALTSRMATMAATTDATTAANVKGGEDGGASGSGSGGDYKGKGRAKRFRVGDREGEEGEASKGAERLEEAGQDEEDGKEGEYEEDTERISWEEVLKGLKLMDLEMRGLGRLSEGPLLRDSLELVESRLEGMKEVFVPLVSRINNTLLDVKGVEQKLTAMEDNGHVFSGDGTEESTGVPEADGTFRLFLLEFKSLLANLDALQKMFLEHGIPSYLSPFYSTLEKLNFMEDMLVREIEMKAVSGKSPAVNEELLARFKSVMKTLDALANMYAADLRFATLSL